MSRRTGRRVPSYRKHKTGQALVRVAGVDYYLGRHGTKESREKYQRLVGEWVAAGCPRPWDGPGEDRKSTSDLTLAELMVEYLRHAHVHYQRDGEVTSEIPAIKRALSFLRLLHSRTLVSSFGPTALMAVREEMISANLARTTINGYVIRIRRMFKWGVAHERVPETVYRALCAVEGLKRGRCRARESAPVEPATEAQIEAVLREVGPDVGAMIKLQLLTAMRPGEVVSLRGSDLDTRGKVWVYAPERHKLTHLGRERVILLGPQAQEVVRPFLKPGQLFSHLRTSYARAIRRACKRAKVPVWSPNQLRHTAATRIRSEYGIEAARIILGHTTIDTTILYAEQDLKVAKKVALTRG